MWNLLWPSKSLSLKDMALLIKTFVYWHKGETILGEIEELYFFGVVIYLVLIDLNYECKRRRGSLFPPKPLIPPILFSTNGLAPYFTKNKSDHKSVSTSYHHRIYQAVCTLPIYPAMSPVTRTELPMLLAKVSPFTCACISSHLLSQCSLL